MDVKELVHACENEFLTTRMEVLERRNKILLALLFKVLFEPVENQKQVVFIAFMNQYLNPTEEQTIKANEYVLACKDKL